MTRSLWIPQHLNTIAINLPPNGSGASLCHVTDLYQFMNLTRSNFETRPGSRDPRTPDRLRPTFRGASRSLWIPATCSLSGTSSSRVTVRGLRGSGKLVQINGSESSRYWTRHTMEVMSEERRPDSGRQAEREPERRRLRSETLSHCEVGEAAGTNIRQHLSK